MPPRILTIVLLLAALGAVGLLASRLVGDGEDGALSVVDAEQEPATLSGALGVSSRDQLSLCVDGAGGRSVSSEDVASVRDALDDVLASVPNVPTDYGEPEVTLGCPAPRGLTSAPVDPFERHDLARMLASPADASPHSYFVFFVGNAAYEAAFPGEPYVIVAEESACEGDACIAGVTQGIYFDRTDSDVLFEGILDLMNLIPPMPEATTDWQACAEGSDEWWCERYGDWLKEHPADGPLSAPAAP